MSLLLAAALALQTTAASPPNAAAQELLACAAAEAASAEAADFPLRSTARVTYFLIAAAQADPGDAPALTRVQQLTPMIVTYAPKPNRVTSVAAACRSRMPLAVAATIARPLPADPFERDVLCFAHLGVLAGAAEGHRDKTKDSRAYDRVNPLVHRFAARMTDAALAGHGLSTVAAFEAFLGKQLLRSLPIGNSDAVLSACEALPT